MLIFIFSAAAGSMDEYFTSGLMTYLKLQEKCIESSHRWEKTKPVNEAEWNETEERGKGEEKSQWDAMLKKKPKCVHVNITDIPSCGFNPCSFFLHQPFRFGPLTTKPQLRGLCCNSSFLSWDCGEHCFSKKHIVACGKWSVWAAFSLCEPFDSVLLINFSAVPGGGCELYWRSGHCSYTGSVGVIVL